MRISDWSADVCTTDLLLYPQRESAPALLLSPGRVLGPSLCGVGLTDCVDDLLNELIGCGILSRSAGDILTRSDVASLTANQSRSEEHTSELQSLMRISYAVFCLKKKTNTIQQHNHMTTEHTEI